MEENVILDKLVRELPNGFELAMTEELSTKMISFKKNDASVVYSIQNVTLNDRVYNNFLGNILGKVIFKEVEYILFPKYKVGDNNPTIDYYGHQKIFNIPKDEGIFSKLPIEYKTEEDIDKGCALITKYINEIAIPFFNYWQDIRDFLPFLETNDNGFIADLFSGDGFYKKVIIWKLCSHPRYNELIEEMLEIFNVELKEAPKDKLLKKDYDRYIKIIKTLEKTKPLYEWDEKYLIQKPYIK
ncbi:hypothetical protein [Flavobacterium davisii]|uniref:Uncharacterized protein n=1 Tax=Flavobacterium columnare TaxID=996 RepID=A0A8G0KSW6_9FLAO|nr:hypothetical protein [Flavobacterium davisii]QYS89496.1 hypothetical protein JJC05_04240 [Flavobacterium davisii]